MVTLFGISIIGKLILFLVGQLPIIENLKEGTTKKLYTCQLCLGCYLFFFLCSVFRFELVTSFVGFYVPILNEIISGMVLSFIVHLISLGWKLKFSEFEVISH